MVRAGLARRRSSRGDVGEAHALWIAVEAVALQEPADRRRLELDLATVVQVLDQGTDRIDVRLVHVWRRLPEREAAAQQLQVPECPV